MVGQEEKGSQKQKESHSVQSKVGGGGGKNRFATNTSGGQHLGVRWFKCILKRKDFEEGASEGSNRSKKKRG